MKNFNWEDFKYKAIAVRCNTEEKAKDFLEECYREGIKFEVGRKRSRAVEGTNSWKWNREETSYYCLNSTKLKHDHNLLVRHAGYKIIDWEIDKTKETIFKTKEITLNTEDVEELADHLVEHASYAFETQDRELLEKVILDYIDMKLREQ